MQHANKKGSGRAGYVRAKFKILYAQNSDPGWVKRYLGWSTNMTTTIDITVKLC